MSWLKNTVRNWLNSDNVIEHEIRAKGYAQPVQVNRDTAPTIQLLKAMNGNIVQCQFYRPATKLHGDSSWETVYYVLKEDESVADAVAALLVNHKLESK
jgi:hypothetical protein